jgi:hypothetical protein
VFILSERVRDRRRELVEHREHGSDETALRRLSAIK